ncbi:MAG TPA: hypothetical protein VNT26_18355, partial [Candidatus Sulfotelmatobacter sp.]|nr:hypothetical protein [Candidatus Sulfotelmatobacter sp.]
ANSFDSEYEMLYGSDAAVMMRENKAWMFKEVDSPLLGWEVYAKKETFQKETGIILRAGASKSVDVEQSPEALLTSTPLYFALENFLRNTNDVLAAAEDYATNYGADDKDGLIEHLTKVPRRPAAGYQEALNATVTAIKANEAILKHQRIELKPEWYELA